MKKKKPKAKISFLLVGLLSTSLIALAVSLITLPFSRPQQSPQTSTPIATPSAEKTSNFPKKEEYIPQIAGNQARVPILMYHYIGNNPNPQDKARDSVSLGPDKFDEEMKYLSDHGYHTITLDTLYPALKTKTTLPDKTLILTFDDGYMDFYYNAYPILQKYRLQATVFIPTALMNQGYYLTWDQIKEMASSGFITFGSHSIHHWHLTTLDQTTLDSELQESKKILTEKLGVPINFIAYPYGSVDARVIQATQKAGYVGAVGTWPSKFQSEGTIYNMPRLRIGGGIDLQTFISLL
jgi:peptidoglycan/xylan/chitin deacetylase (PgdA/CDA1 family)